MQCRLIPWSSASRLSWRRGSATLPADCPLAAHPAGYRSLTTILPASHAAQGEGESLALCYFAHSNTMRLPHRLYVLGFGLVYAAITLIGITQNGLGHEPSLLLGFLP